MESFSKVCATVWSDGLVGRFGRTISRIGRRICRREAIFLSGPGDCFVGAGAICLSEPGDLFSEGGDLFVGTRRFTSVTNQLPPVPTHFCFQTKISSIHDENIFDSRQKYPPLRQKYFRFPTKIFRPPQTANSTSVKNQKINKYFFFCFSGW